MHARERVIRDRFADQACSHCGAHYPPASVVCLAHRRSAWIVMATCGRCERRGIFVVTFPSRSSGAPLIQGGDTPIPQHPASAFPPALPRRSRSEPAPLQPPSSSALPVLPTPDPAAVLPPVAPAPAPARPISDADVDAMRDFLARFDGDFHALFTGRRTSRSDDPSA
jgi:hypothetical protein